MFLCYDLGASGHFVANHKPAIQKKVPARQLLRQAQTTTTLLVKESDVDDSLVNDRFKTGEGFHTVPPPYTGNYMPSRPDLSFAGLDDSIYKDKVSETITTVTKTSKDSVEKPKTVRPSALIIKDWDTDSVFRPKPNQTKPKFTKMNFVKFNENVKFVNKKNTHRQEEYLRKSQSPKDNRRNRNGMMTQKLGNAATSIITARPVNIVAPKSKVNDALPKTYSYFKAHSLVRRAFNQKSAAKTNNLNKKVKTARVNNVTTAGPKAVVSAAVGNEENVGNPQYTLHYQGIFYSGCSKHLTGNKSFLTDYQEVDGGFVAFAGSPKGGKITRKGKIRTGKLDFEDTECVVLSPEFKLLDERQVLLKVHRHNNMYNFDLKNVVPSGGETLLENRVLITKPHNKTPYELLVGRSPNLDFMRPFGCPVTILNTLDHLGKFEGKADEGFLVGYSVNSKAFRVFNSRTRKVEENLHIKFLENKSNVAGSGLEWLFDIDSLTKSMNYEPVTAGNQTNDDAGIETNINAGQAGQEKASDHEYILLPFLPSDSPLSSSNQNSEDKDADDEPGKGDKGFDQERTDSSTQDINTVGLSINTASTNINIGSLNINIVSSNDPNILSLEETIIFDGAYNDEDVGKRAIGTKWVYKNKKDKRGIIVRNKARLVAQGYTQEEGIDYDEVFAPVARIEAIRLFFTYASFMGFIVYQMDVKSAFLYGTIEKEVYVCQPPSFEDSQFPDKVYKVEKALYGLHQAPRAWYETLSTYLLENGFRRGTIDKTLFIKKYRDNAQKILDEFYRGAHFLLRIATSTPIETNKALIKDEEAEDVDVHLYRSMIGSLMFQVTPKILHLHAVKRIFRYLKGQPKLGLWYPRDSPFDLEAFSDSDYAGASLDRKSTTRGCQFLGKRLILWQCKKQTIVANSTTEAEYVAAANCFKNPVFHSKTKHIEIRHHFIRDSNEKKLIQMIKIHTDHNVTDLLTKAFDVGRFQYLIANRIAIGGHTLGSGEDNMEHQIELTDNIPNTPHDLPLPGGYTPGSDEGRLKLEELMAMCTKLSKQVLDLEKEKDAQAVEILNIKKRVKKLERQRKSSISHPRRRIYRQVESFDDDLDEEDASK
ncbi:putative ribonuclease H-like domain-containing protein [Tanacetum coccineum]